MNVKMIVYGAIMLIIFIALWNLFYRMWQIACLIDKAFTNENNQTKQTKSTKTVNNNAKRNTAANAKREYTQRENTQNEYTQRQPAGQNTVPKEEPVIPECLVVLGFTKVPDNKDDIKARFKKLSKIYHPDMGGTQEEFQRINKAWESARKIYDIK